MANLRQRFRVAWDDGEPVEILTTVKDLINAVDRVAANGSANNRVAVTASLIYSALARSTEHVVPDYDVWVDLLDDYEEVHADGDAAPTRSAPLPTGPSPSPASPAPTGAPGSDPTPPASTTPARSKPPKRS